MGTFFGRSQDKDFFLNKRRYQDARRCAIVAGSDSHSFKHLESYLGKEFYEDGSDTREITWIKADLNFEGLRQILYEPEARVFIGRIPEKLQIIEESPRLFIEAVIIETTTQAPEWFDKVGELVLNPELVTIIGNKGSGKSALADIIAMAGNSKTETFSFLNTEKFLALPAHTKYKASLKLKDGSQLKKGFGTPAFDPAEETYVVYLSQDFVREMCDSQNVEVLQQEIDRVIFDKIPFAEKITFETLAEMVAELGSGIEEQIQLERKSLHKINVDIIKYEDYLKPSFRNEKSRLLRVKEEELDALENTGKPKEVKPPSKTQNEATIHDIDKLRKELDAEQQAISALEEKISVLSVDEKELNRIQLQIDSFGSQIDTFAESLGKNNIALRYQITGELLKISRPLSAPIAEIVNRVREQVASLKDKKTKHEQNKTSCAGKIGQLQITLTAKEKEYQVYLTRLAKWEEKKKHIIGDFKISGSMAQLKRWLEFIDSEANGHLRQLELQRISLSNNIAGLLFKKRLLFEGVYSGIREHTKAILQEMNIGEKEFISIDTTLTVASDFEKHFLSMIHQKRKGTFSGVATGGKNLTKLIAKNRLADKNALGQLPELILGALRVDLTQPEDQRQEIQLEDQLVEGVTKMDLYSYLFSLEYIETRAEITYFGKSLRNLSPGEKGTVLLVFYLLMDSDRRPIIIDQPEENLDNETVYRILVPLIKKVKTERQIIIVTHNPNLAVVTDSEQIIRCSIDKEHGDLITYRPGSIEHSEIRTAVVDVLEGTEEAFVNRRDKYELRS